MSEAILTQAPPPSFIWRDFIDYIADQIAQNPIAFWLFATGVTCLVFAALFRRFFPQAQTLAEAQRALDEAPVTPALKEEPRRLHAIVDISEHRRTGGDRVA